MKKYIILLIILLLMFGCTLKLAEIQDDKEPEALGSPEEKPRISVVHGVKVVEMTVRQWEFIPSEISLDKGDKVRLEIESEDVTHGISIPDFGIEAVIEPGEVTEIEFIADKAGEFEFKSNVFSGIGYQDMKGRIIVR